MKNKKGLFVKDPNKWRVPRKLKKKIPKGTVYCYTPLEFPSEKNKWVYKTKPCPFSSFKKFKDMKPLPEWVEEHDLKEFGDEYVEWCKLIKSDLTDSCKSCGLRYPKQYK